MPSTEARRRVFAVVRSRRTTEGKTRSIPVAPNPSAPCAPVNLGSSPSRPPSVCTVYGLPRGVLSSRRASHRFERLGSNWFWQTPENGNAPHGSADCCGSGHRTRRCTRGHGWRSGGRVRWKLGRWVGWRSTEAAGRVSQLARSAPECRSLIRRNTSSNVPVKGPTDSILSDTNAAANRSDSAGSCSSRHDK